MPHVLRILLVAVAAAAGFAAAPALAQKSEPAPKPDTYLCPNATGGAVDCFLHAVEHLYTMCRQVKSIEIIEFGYDKSDEGVNGAKSEYCVDKHKASMARPYQAALREAKGSHPAADSLRGLYELWMKALAELKWKPGETDDQYKARIAQPYDAFRERSAVVRTALASGNDTAVAAGRATGGTPKAAATKNVAAAPAKRGN
jgi:hypothetical protein